MANFWNNQWDRVHFGRKPRGHGVWAFSFKRNGEEVVVVCRRAMSFVEAKKWARHEFPNVDDFEVMP
jgi:hypothetical protein